MDMVEKVTDAIQELMREGHGAGQVGAEACARVAISTYEAALSEKGLVIVPREPDFEMLDDGCYGAETPENLKVPAGGDIYHPDLGWTAQAAHDDLRVRWQAMINVAPKG